MLEVLNVSQIIKRPKQEALTVLDQVSFGVPKNHLIGIIGPAGSGKSSLIRLLAGRELATEGVIAIQGRDSAAHPPHANSIGHVPASDDVLCGVLTVRETLMSSLMLRVAGQSHEQRVDKTSHILVGLGLETLATQRVSTLTLPQRRRLKLALALVSDAPLVLCDEFTDGLDVKSEQELTALLKFVVSDQPGRIVVHATQTLGSISSYDTVVILLEGRVCFHGPARAVAHYFSISTIEELYPRLAKRPAERWGDSWTRHRESYYEAFKLGDLGRSLTPPTEDEKLEPESKEKAAKRELSPASEESSYSEPHALPSAFQQAAHLIRRRWSILRRTQREWLQHLLLLVLSPLLVTLLTAPNTIFLTALKRGDLAPASLWPAAYTCTMVIFIQTLLIMMMSVRNGAREIARERLLLERERAGGLSMTACLFGKLGFLIPIVIAQSLALSLFAEMMGCSLPGNGLQRLLLLMLTGMAFTSLCLGISARSRNPDRAQSHAWMLLVANVVLCGALLGFPRILGGVIQPLVTAYYGWSGSVETLHGTPVFEPITSFVRTWFATPAGAILALLAHTLIGLVFTLTGLKKAG